MSGWDMTAPAIATPTMLCPTLLLLLHCCSCIDGTSVTAVRSTMNRCCKHLGAHKRQVSKQVIRWETRHDEKGPAGWACGVHASLFGQLSGPFEEHMAAPVGCRPHVNVPREAAAGRCTAGLPHTQVSAPSDVAMVRMLASKRGEVSGEPWA